MSFCTNQAFFLIILRKRRFLQCWIRFLLPFPQFSRDYFFPHFKMLEGPCGKFSPKSDGLLEIISHMSRFDLPICLGENVIGRPGYFFRSRGVFCNVYSTCCRDTPNFTPISTWFILLSWSVLIYRDWHKNLVFMKVGYLSSWASSQSFRVIM